jgi:hypothetical protein
MQKIQTMKEPKAAPESGTVVHNHEASAMWIAVLFAALFAALVAEKAVEAWRAVELEKVRAKQ